MTPPTCSKPATAMVQTGDKEWTPVCEDHLNASRAKSAKAGKKPMPKGATKAQAAAIAGTNRDDALPIQARALTAIERDVKMPCMPALLEDK